MSKRIVVVGVDGSNTSLDALREARVYAQLLNAELRCVTSWNYMAYEDAAGVFDPEKTAEEVGRDSVGAVFGETLPEWVTFVTKLGPAGDALVAESEHATLLVVGTRGHSAVVGLLLGSVSTHCAEHAKCPVLVVPPVAHRNGELPGVDDATPRA